MTRSSEFLPMTEPAIEPLSVDAVRFRVDPSVLGIDSSDDLSAADAIVGQGAALDALKMSRPDPAPIWP